jgi:hypothetical protein
MSSPMKSNNRLSRQKSLFMILIAGLFSYLPTAYRWGFYRDDWHVLWGQNAVGIGNIFLQHQIDRPLMGLVYMVTARVLGNPPIAWVLLSICLRLAGGIIVFLIFEKLYAKARWMNTLMAALFTVYPGFLQVPNAHSYHVHLIAFTAGLFSIYLTLLLIERENRVQRMLLLFVAAAIGLLSYGMFEWMIGVELVRLVLIIFHTAPQPRFNFTLIKNTIRQSWPSLICFFSFLIWRVFFFESTRAATDVKQLLRSYASSPGQNFETLSMELLKDIVNTVFLAWGVPFYQFISNARYSNIANSIVLAALVVFIFWFISSKIETEAKPDPHWAKTALWVGGLSTLVCLLPTAAAGRYVIFRDGLERYTLLPSFGVVQFLAGLTVLVLRSKKAQHILLLTLLASGVFVQNLNGVAFGDFWEAQRQLWWQITWRIPNLQDGSALIVNMPPHAPFAEDYEVWGPANLIYRPESNQVLIAGGTFSKDTIHKLMYGSKFGRTMRNITYAGDMKNAVVVSYPTGSCVHVMDPNIPLYSLNDDLRAWLAAARSNPSMIQPNAVDISPPKDIFGKEPVHRWCYYYQKTAMAVQFEQWEQAAQYADEALTNDLRPIDPAEWMPLYIAYAKTGNMDRTNDLASVLRSEPGLVENFCQAMAEKYTSTDEFYVYNLCTELKFLD